MNHSQYSLDMPKPSEVIQKVLACVDCEAQNEHSSCAVNWQHLQDWMEQVQAQLTSLTLRER